MLPSCIMKIYKIIHTAWQYNKINESNRQMLARISIKFLIFIFIILTFDSLLGWFLECINYLFTLVHLLIESIEYSLIVVLEYTLQTDRHHSEAIIVNGTIMIALYALYRLYLNTPKLYLRIKRNFFAVCLKHMKREFAYWRTLKLNQKATLITCYITGFGCLFLFIL